ncbi:hypothetical protein Nepgr_012576 [Nepenthes gracilis]|uniref:Ribonuclease H2 subunit B n=1 Tax=Nepenthes gracilis TaxID=150966 RepID=A0AAD3SH64_NEPGR|nr:hypothetical protein Nepgr_012576 [Nepenthes gracilis]
MAWWVGADGDIRVLIAPDQGSVGSSPGHLLSLLHPRSGISTVYLFINDSLQELHWFKQSYGSWFLGDYVCEDGSMYMSTPIDPVFIMLPIFEKARFKKGDDPGKFRQLDEMVFVDGHPGYQQLLPVVEKSMHVVCEVKEVGSVKFFRLDDSKVLAWLCQKVYRLKLTLLTLDKNYAAQDEKHTMADAVSILREYLKDDPWLKLLCNHLRLNLEDLARKAAGIDALPSAADKALGSSLIQENREMEKKAAVTVRQKKKVKLEKDSQNIKDMFSRATRRGSKTT